MRRIFSRFWMLAWLSWAGLVAPWTVAAEGAPVGLTARVTEVGAINRLEVDLSERVAFRTFKLTEPNRIVIDFPAIEWRLEAPRPGQSIALIDGVRFGARRDGARMVIDLRETAQIQAAFTAPAAGDAPARFVVELAPMDAAAFQENAGWPMGVEPEKDTATALRRDVLVVIDPGHGGRDIGAVSGDLAESHLMLDYAKRLAREIKARPGYDALLTRDEDVFLTLRQRVEITRKAGGDLFLSLHADSLEQGFATGASAFTLSEEATSEEALALAESANRADQLAGVPVDVEEDDVTRVLIAFAQRRTSEQSIGLAQEIIGALEGRAPVLRDREIQSAGFRVLKAPDVPSVLLELGFLSSPKDRQRLLSEEGREALIVGIANGVFAWVEAQDGERYAPARRAAGR